MDTTQNPIFRLLGSSKAIVVIAITVASFAALYAGKAQWDQVKDLVTWLCGTWLVGQGVEDAAKHVAAGKVAAAKASLPPPPMDKA